MMIGSAVTVTATGRKAKIIGIERDFYLIEFRDGTTDRYKGFGLRRD